MEISVMRYAFLAMLLAQPARADQGEYRHMADWAYGYGVPMMFGPVLWLVVLGLMVAGVVWFVRGLDAPGPRQGASSAMEELDMRFAKGEIDAKDYAERKKLLGS